MKIQSLMRDATPAFVKERATSCYIYHSPSFALLRDAEGNPSDLVGFPVNITAQKPGDLAVRRTQEVERELQESEAGFVPPVKSALR
jgi:hypothetical protein